MKIGLQYKKQVLYVIGICILSLVAAYPLFHAGFFVTDDGEWMLIRFTAFHQALVDGQFPVRWLGRLNFAYGYPAANFMYPGFMYLGEFFRLLGFGYVTTVKLILGISLIGSGIFTYLWLRQRFSDFSSFVASIIYVYAPYHLYDIYKRGSVGEVLALCVVPFVLWMLERKNLFFTALGIALLILSHNTLAALFLPVIIIYYLLSQEKIMYFFLLKSVVLGLGVSSFFWIPALYDLQYTVFSQVDVSSITEYFQEAQSQYLSIFSIIFLGITVVTALASYSFVKQVSKNIYYPAVLFFVILLGVLVMNLSFSQALWKILPISFIQFPFRLFSLEMLSVSYLTCLVISLCKGKIQYVLAVALFILLSFPTFVFVPHIKYMDKGDDYYATNDATTTVKNEYMPTWVKSPFSTRADSIINEDISIANVVKKSNEISFNITVPETTKVTVNQLYFPGWERISDKSDDSITPEPATGLIQLVVEKEDTYVQLVFKETPVRLISDVLSLISFGILVILSIKIWRNYETK